MITIKKFKVEEPVEEFNTFDISFKKLQKKIDLASRRLKAISHPSRLKIVSLLINTEYTVQSLSLKTGIPQSTLSQHLSVLRERDIVEYRKDGQYSHYSLSDKNIYDLYLTAMQF